MNISSGKFSLPFVEPPSIIGEARVILLQIGRTGESLAIAIIGQLDNNTPFAKSVTPHILRSLPNDLGYACQSFGALVVSDFLSWSNRPNPLDTWTPPFSGVLLTEKFEIDGYDLEGVVEAALSTCALHTVGSNREITENAPLAPRSSEEVRFLDSVRTKVLRVAPRLAQGFRKTFSLMGAEGFASEIDFVGSRYATCYAAINPKKKGNTKLQTASAALWRLARARDAFGFAAPTELELTAWVPPPEMPIYTAEDYKLVQQAVAELSEQARREGLSVFPAHDADTATSRLIKVETETFISS